MLLKRLLKDRPPRAQSAGPARQVVQDAKFLRAQLDLPAMRPDLTILFVDPNPV